MTLADIEQRVWERMDDDPAQPVITETAVRDAINRGLRLFSLITLCCERTASFTLAPGVVWYDTQKLMPGFLVPLRTGARAETVTTVSEFDAAEFGAVLFDEPAAETIAQRNRIRPANLAELDAIDPAWQLARGTALQHYGCAGPSLFYVYPAPANGTTIRVYLTHAACATALTAATHVPEIPAEFHNSLADIACVDLALPEGASELTRFEPELDRFLNDAMKLAAYTRARSQAMRYDREPFELTAADRSRLVQTIAGKGKAA